MTDEQSAQIVLSLSKIENHLAAIDWKLWDMHQKFSKDATDPISAATVGATDSDLDGLATIINEIVQPAGLSPRPAAVPTAINQTAMKYPSIEILK